MTASNHTSGYYYQEQLPDFGAIVKRKITKTFKWDTVQCRLPILKWLPNYKPKYFLEDTVAGLTVGLTAIPQAIAYAVVAGLQPQYGLYSAFMGCFVYILFGSCKDITVGPTALMAIMVQVHVRESPDFAILSCFLAGCIITVLGLLNLGFLVQFISMPVTTGFTVAAAIAIGSSQINALFGIASKSNDFIGAWTNFFQHIENVKLNDSVLGITTLILLLLLRKLKDVRGPFKFIAKYLSLSRNALAVAGGTTIAYFLTTPDYEPFRLTGKIESGLPPFQLPPFSTTTVNGTDLNFGDMMNRLGSSLITLSLVAILESIAIAKAFSKGKTVDATQEMIALGLCNLMGSFVRSMPVTGSFTRTAVNHASGVRTPLGGAITGCLVLLSLGFLAETFYFIPKATLAAVIITAMILMVDCDKIIFIWKAKKIDLVSFIATIIACLFLGLEYGILLGILLSNFIILVANSRPKVEIIKEKLNRSEIIVVNLNQSLSFASADYIKSTIIKAVSNSAEKVACVIMDGRKIQSMDSTVALNLISIKEDLRVLECELIFWNWPRGTAGVLCRTNAEYAELFKTGESTEEVFFKHFENKNGINTFQE